MEKKVTVTLWEDGETGEFFVDDTGEEFMEQAGYETSGEAIEDFQGRVDEYERLGFIVNKCMPGYLQ